MPWLTKAQCVARGGAERMAALTSNGTEPVILARGDGIETVFDTTFYRATSVLAFEDGVAASPAVTLLPGAADDENDQIDFGTGNAPSDEAVITAKSHDGIYVTDLYAALYDGQELVSGFVRAAGRTPPAEDAAAPKLLQSWAWTVAAYKLMVSPKRQPLHWDDIETDYFVLIGGGPNKEPGILPRLSRMPSFLDGILPPLVISTSSSPTAGISYGSECPVFDSPNGEWCR